MTTEARSLGDVIGGIGMALFSLGVSLIVLAAGVWISVKVWSSVDCTIDPQSDRCVYLDKAQWERFK